MEHQKSKYKQNIAIVVLAALLLGEGCFVYFNSQKPIFRAIGKFSYYYPSSANNSKVEVPYTSETLTKSLAESIKTRSFVEDLLTNANVDIGSDLGDKIDKVLQAKVLPGSNIIEVKVANEDKAALGRISDKFFDTVKASSFASDQGPKAEIKVVDPLYVDKEPYYPKPLAYALIAFATVLVIGFIVTDAFSSNE